MSLAFLAPFGFAALAAWAVPLVIHLVRRADRRETPFAALRWIRGPERPRSRLRFEHLWLLLARLLLIAAFAVLLAQPALDNAATTSGAWVAVVPGADIDAARGNIDAGANWHWLAPGFPALGGATPAPDASATVSSLIRELDANLPADTPLTIVVPAQLGALDAERIALNRRVTWRVVDGATPTGDTSVTTRTIALRYTPEAATALPALRAAVAALNVSSTRYRLDAQDIGAALPGDASWIIWLGTTSTPALTARVADGATALVDRGDASGDIAWRDDDGRALARTHAEGRGRWVTLTQSLAPATFPLLLDATFPTALEHALQGLAQPARAMATAVAPVQATREVTPAKTAAIGIDAWLILAIVALLLVERLLAWRASREASP